MKNIDKGNNFPIKEMSEIPVKPSLAQDQAGKIGYLIAWILGVPAWILLIVFLVRGH